MKHDISGAIVLLVWFGFVVCLAVVIVRVVGG